MNKRRKGSKYEDIAAGFLVKKGYRILQCNYHFERFAEIDIIAAAPDGCIVFCEVKYRSSVKCGTALNAVDARKRINISKAALAYLMSRGLSTDVPCRFDVIGIDASGLIVHVVNAFDYAWK